MKSEAKYHSLAKTTPLGRSTKRLANRRTFKAHGSNPLKTYHRKYTDAQDLAHAQEKRRERLANPTEAETVMGELLAGYGLAFEREAIFINGDRFILIDILIRSASLAIEIDGSVHKRQSSYDAQRDRWLAETHGIKTYRLSNDEVLKRPEKVKAWLSGIVFGNQSEIHLTP